jgi:sarcosine oxidase subunit gamma
MNTLSRTSPLHDAQAAAAAWMVRDAMQVVRRFSNTDTERLRQCGIGDLSFRRRTGVKGPGARAWLQAQGVQTPELPNSWIGSAGGALVARLGLSEYLVETADEGSGLVAQLDGAAPTAGVYPTPRFDAALVLAGAQVQELLKQTCSFDVDSLDSNARPVVITSMVGVGVTLIAQDSAVGRHYRLWCDGTYGEYLWLTLVAVAESLGGGAVGIDALAGVLG